MRYISIDIETLGLDPLSHSTIQFGAVIEDTKNILPLNELPRFECLISHRDYHGTPFAMAMHHELFKELAQGKLSTKLIVEHSKVAEEFAKFLKDNSVEKNGGCYKINVAGKNFATFDKLFLEQLPDWKKHIQITQRILDPAILFWDPLTDETLPNLEECKRRAGLSTTKVAHTAVEDALDVIELLRTKYK